MVLEGRQLNDPSIEMKETCVKETGISYPVNCHLNVHMEEKCPKNTHGGDTQEGVGCLRTEID